MLCVLVASLLPNWASSPMDTGEMMMIQDNSLMPILVPSYSVKIASLGDLMALDDAKQVKEKYKAFLKQELLSYGKTEKDFLIMQEVLRCESSWRQYWENGEVIVVKGNVGLGQVNILAHKKTYTEMGLDIYEPYDNLRFTAFLYVRDGLNPWLKWSGHCFLPKIKGL